MSRPLPWPDSMKQFACPSNGCVISRPATCSTKFLANNSTEKCATDPAFAAEMPRGDRLGERTLQRCHIGDLDPVTHATLGEERVGEEREFQRRDRALDRHLGDVHDQLATLPARKLVPQRGGAVEGVEVEDALAT